MSIFRKTTNPSLSFVIIFLGLICYDRIRYQCMPNIPFKLINILTPTHAKEVSYLINIGNDATSTKDTLDLTTEWTDRQTWFIKATEAAGTSWKRGLFATLERTRKTHLNWKTPSNPDFKQGTRSQTAWQLCHKLHSWSYLILGAIIRPSVPALHFDFRPLHFSMFSPFSSFCTLAFFHSFSLVKTRWERLH